MMWDGAYRMMGWGGWLWPFHFIVPLLITGLIVAAVVALVMMFRRTDNAPDGHHSRGVDVLEHRYARGEISREEYLQKRSDILA